MTKEVITYTRVSTAEQGRSGLGLEAQADQLRAYVERLGYEVIREHQEVASGGSCDLSTRPVLAAAVAQAATAGATILVAKLDRLSRSAKLVEDLLHEGVAIEAADVGPTCALFELKLRVLLAEDERAKIGERTRAALAAKRARGEQLGNVENLRRHGHRGRETRRLAALQAAARHRPMFAMLEDLNDLAAARKLNELGYRTTSGTGRWHSSGVARVRARLGELTTGQD